MTTEAGKRLRGRIWPFVHKSVLPLIEADIAAIEAEAASDAFREMAEGQTDLALTAVAAERERIAAEVEAMAALEDEDFGVEMWWVIRDDVLAIVRGEPNLLDGLTVVLPDGPVIIDGEEYHL